MENIEILNNFSEFLMTQEGLNPVLIIGIAFVGGLLSSVSPCVLGLLPINLAYIGTANIDSKKEAFTKAALFVAGVSVILTLLGLFGNFAFAVFTEYRGQINLGIGIFIILMALVVMDTIKVPLPHFVEKVPETNPFVVGIVFAFVSSPCSSPVLFAVLTVASSIGSYFWSMIIMFAYSLGYTAIIFFASLFAGLMKQLNWFKSNSGIVLKVSGTLLIAMGLFYIYYGASVLLR